jgi:hypothetical protein
MKFCLPRTSELESVALSAVPLRRPAGRVALLRPCDVRPGGSLAERSMTEEGSDVLGG